MKTETWSAALLQLAATPRFAFAFWFVAVLATALPWLLHLHLIFDTDSYFHLAVAREYWQYGPVGRLEWARFSVMRDGYGDKEVLFHLLGAPFAALPDPELGAKLLMSLLIAANVASVACLAVRALGALGMFVPALLYFGSVSFLLRVIRFRPELLALLLFVWTLYALVRKRYVLAAALAFLFAWSYTAIHALVGLCGLCFLAAFYLERKPSFGIVLGPSVGAGLGLLLHPHFPKNLEIFVIQNLSFWQKKAALDVGAEIHAIGLLPWLSYDWPLLAGVAILAASLTTLSSSAREISSAHLQMVRRAAVFFGLGALVFDAMFSRMGRFAIYAVPLSLLALSFLVCAKGGALGVFIALPRAKPLRTALPLTLLVLVAALHSFEVLERTADRSGGLYPVVSNQMRALGAAIPKGAKVATTWQSAGDYVYWAPHATYLNVLDPVFMHLPYPREHAELSRLFAGQVSDVPLVLESVFDSDHVAFEARVYPALYQQLVRDPRMTQLVPSGHVVFRVDPGANDAFVLDFAVHEDAEKNAARTSVGRYPRAQTPRARALEGVVAPERLGGAPRCLWFRHVRGASRIQQAHYEVASRGPLTLFADGQELAELKGQARLAVGQGTQIEAPSSARELDVRACPGPEGLAHFYLLARP